MRALVLSGGGVKGAYQVGALQKWMAEDGIDYDVLCGISVGAINCAYLAQSPKGAPKEAHQGLHSLWKQVSDANIKRCWVPFGAASALWKRSVYDSRPLQRWIATELKPDAIRKSGRLLRMVAVSWNSGESRVITEKDEHLADWVAASSAFPVMLSPVDIGEESWTDGGLRSVTPLGQAIDAGATEIDVIMCSSPFGPSPFDPRNKPALPALAKRAIEIMCDQITRADLQICGLKNHLAKLNATKHRQVTVRTLEPSAPLVDDALSFDPQAIKEMIAQGYKDACAAAAKA